MAIVARRTLQRLIRENAAFTSSAQRQRHAGAINRGGPQSLSSEWEILVLNALSKLVRVEHEVPLGSRRPDILAHIVGDPVDSFAADIATAFEESDDDRNPAEALSRLIGDRAWQKHGLSGNGFQLDVKGERQGPHDRERMQLKLPDKSKIEQFFHDHVSGFVDLVAVDPGQAREQTISSQNIDLKVSYHPGKTSAGVSFPSYTTRYSTTNNPIFGILKRKTHQLKAFDGPRCVVLCGADSPLPRRVQPPGFGLKEIAAEFFRQSSSLSCIATLYVARTNGSSALGYEFEVYVNGTARNPMSGRALDVIRALPAHLPPPQRDGPNAVGYLEFLRERRSIRFLGSFQWKQTMDQHTVKVSSRELVELLAGEIDHDTFVSRLGGSGGLNSVFARQLREGRLLDQVKIERRPDDDDDWVVFRFGPPDPAVAPLQPE